MSTIVKILVFILLNATMYVLQNEVRQDITVNISGLDNDKGKILVGLYNSEGHFLETEFMSKIGQISSHKSTIIFKNVPEGVYAISFVHDENDNNKMDTNFLGIPKEDYGCSNNAKGFMGPPKWSDAKFILKGKEKTINISI